LHRRRQLDFDATSLTLIFEGVVLFVDDGTFTGLDFLLTTPHGITGVSLSGTVPNGFTASDVTFTANGISVNLENIALSGNQPLVLNFSFDSNPVPTPATLPLVLAGLAGLAYARRRG
jgi:hypothetical protein